MVRILISVLVLRLLSVMQTKSSLLVDIKTMITQEFTVWTRRLALGITTVTYSESDIIIPYGKSPTLILSSTMSTNVDNVTKTLLLSAIYNKIWLFGGHDKDTDVVEVFDTIKGIGIHDRT